MKNLIAHMPRSAGHYVLLITALIAVTLAGLYALLRDADTIAQTYPVFFVGLYTTLITIICVHLIRHIRHGLAQMEKGSP